MGFIKTIASILKNYNFKAPICIDEIVDLLCLENEDYRTLVVYGMVEVLHQWNTS